MSKIIKAVKLPEDLNSALSYIVKHSVDSHKPSEVLRLALAMRYKIAEPIMFSAENNHPFEIANPYYFSVPEAMHKLMRKEKEKTGMTDQAIIVNSFRRIVNFY
jgi:hypothetical protein